MTGPLADVDLAILLTFAVGVLVAVCSTIVIAGFLPIKDVSGTAAARVSLIACTGLLTAVLAVVLLLTAALLPTTVAVIAAGAAILSGPFLVEPIPERLREAPLTLVAAAIFAIAALAMLPWPF